MEGATGGCKEETRETLEAKARTLAGWIATSSYCIAFTGAGVR
jgi:hypothetical protein